MLILRRSDVTAVLDDDPRSVLQTVRETYVAHSRSETSVPHSAFLRFPDDARNRIIALPAYVGGGRPVAALKWIASFPGNIARGAERASAAILLSSVSDGRPVALIEGSVISARRTAASAAVAAESLTAAAPEDVRSGVGLIGCGVINHEVLRFLRFRFPQLKQVTVADIDPDRARTFADTADAAWPELDIDIQDVERALAQHRMVCLATTAGTPHLTTAACRPGTVVLHLSLRDLAAESILAARNVVDDADHVCRAATSLDLAEQQIGDRRFITGEIGDLLAGTASVPYVDDSTVVFSPFGLGALDAAVAAHVHDAAAERGLGVELRDFLGS